MVICRFKTAPSRKRGVVCNSLHIISSPAPVGYSPFLLTVKTLQNNAQRDNLEGFWRHQFGMSHGVPVTVTVVNA